MDVEVGVDSASDGAVDFYDGHCHPFLSSWFGVARPSREGVTVRADLLAQVASSPLWSGTCHICVLSAEARVDKRSETMFRLFRSDPEPRRSRNY